MCQLSGDFSPLPPETTISASFRFMLPATSSRDDIFSWLSEIFVSLTSSVPIVGFSFTPKELTAMDKTFFSVLDFTILNAFPEKIFLLTCRGDVFSGNSITLVISEMLFFTDRLVAIADASLFEEIR